MAFISKYVNLCGRMDLLKKLISFTLLPVFLLMLAVCPSQAQPQVAYERGLEELYLGNTTRALDIWYEAYQEEGGVDSRIGFEFIRVVTESEMHRYFEEATELYYRALLNGSGMDSRVAIRQEIDRLRPLVGEGMHRQWMEWWEEGSPELGPDMRGYWVREDPTPSRVSNERLIEHWERIAAAKNRFTRNSRTVYGTDERALIYIRYGEPDRTRSGILTLQMYNVKNWLHNQLNPYAEVEEGRPGQSTGEENMPNRQQLLDRLEDAIYEFHRYPEYEVWFYDDLATEGNDPVLFIFGTDVRSEEFRLQRSIDDFIPERAFNPERTRRQDGVEFTRAGITPALMLQMLYYEQLVQVDPLFEERLNKLRDNVLEQGLQALQGMDLNFREDSREVISQRSLRAPNDKSAYVGEIPSIPFEVYQYRFLDEDLNPYVLTYLESSAHEAFLIDYHRNRVRQGENARDLADSVSVTDDFPYYQLVHTLQEYDENWNRSESFQDNPGLVVNRTVGDRPISRSMFTSPHTSRNHQSASVELMNYDPESRKIFNTPFHPALRGLNKIQFRMAEPLQSYADSLEMADLVLGYESDEVKTEPFPFVVANDAQIPAEETLVLHFEVYNLERHDDETEFTEFELTYRILPVDESGEVRTDQAEFVLTLNFINEHTTVIEDLEIETADLHPGLYDLRVRVVDMITGQEKERTTRFEVIE